MSVIGQESAETAAGKQLPPLPKPPQQPSWGQRAWDAVRGAVKAWPRSTQVAAGAAVVLGLVVLVLLVVVAAWRGYAEELLNDRDTARGQAERFELQGERLRDELEPMADDLAAAERAVERARDRADNAEARAQEAADQELEERIAESEAELEEARQEIADTQATLEEREAQLAQREAQVGQAEAESARNTFGAGVHIVGQDIEPGTYQTQGSGSCYWARLRGLSGEFGDIIANGLPSGPASVQIHASDVAFESSGCGQWTRR